MTDSKTAECQCASADPPSVLAKSSWHSTGALILNVLILLFPKCPMCWAAYMSLLGGVGLAHLPYMGWLFYLLLGFLSLHLLLLFKYAQQKGYAPFVFCLCGSLAVLSGRLFWADPWLPNGLGLSFITLSALWNLRTNVYKGSES